MQRKLSDIERVVLGKDRLSSGLQGEYWDEEYERGPDGGRVLVRKTERHHNDIVITEKQLVLALLKNDLTQTQGIVQWAFGVGDPSWDTSGAPAVDPDLDVTLFDEFATGVGRITPDSIVFLDLAGGSVLPDHDGATALRIQVTIPFIHPMNGSYFREQGLFGGSATTVKDSGLMVDNFRHERRPKSASNEYVFFVELFYA